MMRRAGCTQNSQLSAVSSQLSANCAEVESIGNEHANEQHAAPTITVARTN
jgi:hypothetical protein